MRARARESRRLVDAYVRLHRAWYHAAETPDVVRLHMSRRRIEAGDDDGTGVVVSMTSFPARIRHAWISIESISCQVPAPDRIVLVLAEEEFAGRTLPRKLREQQERGLEIMYVARNARRGAGAS